MKTFLIVAASLCITFIALPASAQMTGGSVVHAIGDGLDELNDYSVVFGTSTVLLKDVSTGSTVFVIKESGSQTVTLSSVIATLRSITPERRERLLSQINQFNFSSPVGTLWYDNASGVVTMEHHVNPRLVSTANMVSVARWFGDAVRAEQTLLTQ